MQIHHTAAILLLFVIFSCSTINKRSEYSSEIISFREKYKEDFLQNPRSPLTKDDLKFLDFYPATVDWKLNCQCMTTKGSKPFELPTYSGVTRTYILHAIATCAYKGKKISLNLYKNITQPINPLYKNHLFLPFKDHTNGESTYGGGRYINLNETDIQNQIITIDFNKCYNPWCAYSDGYNCPIPPKENHLELSVTAGEKRYTGPYKK